MKVIEIFNSIDGEGKRAGELTTFIRLAGCNLQCPYCDTKYSWSDKDATEMSVLEIAEFVSRNGYTNVTITGGEPLIHPDIKVLLRALSMKGCDVNVETNGSIDIDRFRCPHVFFTVDYKCPSSGMEDKMCFSMFNKLRGEDVLKFVVGSRDDLQTARRVTQLLDDHSCLIYISPVFGQIEPAEIVQFMQEHRMEDWRIQLQLHKFIWDPNKRGV